MWDLFTYKEMKCFSQDDLKLLSSDVSVVSAMSPTPYLLLGMESGNIRIVQLLSSNMQPADEGRQVVGYKLMQQLVNADQLNSVGNVDFLQPLISPNDQILVLILHSVTGVMIWDLKVQTTIVDPQTQIGNNGGSFVEASDKVLKCQWMDLNGKYFCTINNRFIIQVWRVTQPFELAYSANQQQNQNEVASNALDSEVQVDCVLQFSILDDDNIQLQVQDFCWIKYREYDNSLQQIFVVVLNDIQENTDDVLIIKFPMIDEDLDKMIVTRDMVSKIQDLPDSKILSMSVLYAEGSVFHDDEVQNILFLLENDRIYIFDPRIDKTNKYAPMFQMLCEPNCIIKSPSFLIGKGEEGASNGDTFIDHVQIQYLKRQSFAKNLGGISSKEWKKIAGAGLLPKTYSESALDYPLAMVGHSDGFLRLWQFSSEQPQLLASLPSSIEIFTIQKNFGQAWFGEITQTEVDWSRGYVIAGTSLGEVFIFRYVNFELSKAETVEQGLGNGTNQQSDSMLEDIEEVKETESYQIKWMDKNQRTNIMNSKFHYGFQLELMGQFHYCQITSIAYDYDAKLLCLGDENGGVSITNLNTGQVLLDHVERAGNPKIAISKILLNPTQEDDGNSSPLKQGKAQNQQQTQQQDEIELLIVYADGTLKRISKPSTVPVTSCKLDTLIKSSPQSGKVLYCDCINEYTGLNQQIYMEDWFRYHELQNLIYANMGVQNENADNSVSTPSKSSAQDDQLSTPTHSPAKKYLEYQRAQNSDVGQNQHQQTIQEENTGDLLSDQSKSDLQLQSIDKSLLSTQNNKKQQNTDQPEGESSYQIDKQVSQEEASPKKQAQQSQREDGINQFLDERGQDIRTSNQQSKQNKHQNQQDSTDPSLQAFRTPSQDETQLPEATIHETGILPKGFHKDKIKNLSKNMGKQFRNAKGNLESQIKQRVNSARDNQNFQNFKASFQSSKQSSIHSSPSKKGGWGLLKSFNNASISTHKSNQVLSQLFSNILLVQQHRLIIFRQGKNKLKEVKETHNRTENDKFVWANIIVLGDRPLLVVITQYKMLQVYTLPGLNLLYELELQRCIPIDISTNVHQLSNYQQQITNQHEHDQQVALQEFNTPQLDQITVSVDAKGWLLLFGIDQSVVIGSLNVRPLQESSEKSRQQGQVNISDVMLCDPKQLFSEDLAAACSQTQQMLFQKNIARNNSLRQQQLQKQAIENYNKQGVFGGLFNNMNVFGRKTNSQPNSRPMSPVVGPERVNQIKKQNSSKLPSHLNQQQSLKKITDIQPQGQQGKRKSQENDQAHKASPTTDNRSWWSRVTQQQDQNKANNQQKEVNKSFQPPQLQVPEQGQGHNQGQNKGYDQGYNQSQAQGQDNDYDYEQDDEQTKDQQYQPLEDSEPEKEVEKERQQRDQLFQGAKPTQRKEYSNAPQDRQKLIDDIKAKYGFQPKPRNDVGNVGNIANQNRQMLAERGLKLGTMQDSAQDMADDAEDFSRLATKLAERQKNRKWFGL